MTNLKPIKYVVQWGSQNSEKVTHIKGRPLDLAVVSPRFRPIFKMGTSFKGKNLLPEGANSFL